MALVWFAMALPLPVLAGLWWWGRDKPSFRRANPQLYEPVTAVRTALSAALVYVAFVPAILLEPPWSLAAFALLGAPALGLGWAHATGLRAGAASAPEARQLADRQARLARTRGYWLGVYVATYATVLLGWAATVTGSTLVVLAALLAALVAGVLAGRGVGTFLFLAPPLYPRPATGGEWMGLPASGLGLAGLAAVTLTLAGLVVLDRPGPVVAAVLGLHAALGFAGTWAYARQWRAAF